VALIIGIIVISVLVRCSRGIIIRPVVPAVHVIITRRGRIIRSAAAIIGATLISVLVR
jgi:hypothetical protein